MRGVTLVAALAAALASTPLAARMLLQAEGAQVSLSGELRCGEPARVDIVSDRADLFAQGSPRLQGLLDATRAMLGYECRDLPEIQVTGRTRGSTRVRYQGSANAASQWLLASQRSASTAPAPPPPAAAAPAPAPAPTVTAAPPAPVAGSRFAVRDLTTGMSPEAAMRQARQSFDAVPSYDAKRREMSVARGSCPVTDTEVPRLGSLCLQTLFTDGNDPRAYRVRYAQVVDQDQRQAIATQLQERFGRPMLDEEQRGSGWLKGGVPERRLAWGRTTRGDDGQPRHELEAQLRLDGSLTVLVLDLVDPGLVEQAPRYQVRF